MAVGKRVAQAAGIVLIMNLMSRVLGFVRDVVIAGKFGATGATDAFMVAYTIPYFLQAILGMAFIMVIVPLLSEYIERGKISEAWKASSTVLNCTAVSLLVITAVGMLLSTQIVGIMAPGFDGEMAHLTRELVLIMFPSVIFMGLGMMLTGMLNAQRIFGLPAFAPAVNNIVVIGAVVTLGGYFGIHGLAVGVLLGFAFFCLVQLPALRKLGFEYSPTFNFRHPAVKRMAGSIMPILFGVGINQIYLAINRIFASMVEVGSIAAIDFAYRVINLPLGVFAAAISTVAFPAMSGHAASNDRSSLKETLVRGLNLIAFIMVPSAVGLMILHNPLIELIFQRGQFDEHATLMTGEALLFFSIGLFSWGANMLIVRAFYAVNDIRTPVVTGMISVVINVAVSIFVLPILGHAGLALANSLAVTGNTFLLGILIKRHLPGINFREVYNPFFRILAASIVMGVIVYYSAQIIMLPVYLTVPICVGIGTVAYGAAVFVFRVEEAGYVKELLKEKVKKLLG